MSKDKDAMAFAIATSQLSKCKRKKTGAVILAGIFIVVGYNRLPKNTPTEVCNQCPREKAKSGDWTNNTCPVIHAEIDVIESAKSAGLGTQGTTMYCTYKPCLECAKAIVKAGIKTVYYLNDHDVGDVNEYLAKKKVKLIRYDK